MRLAALKAENPKLIAFDNSLDARQKEKFDRFREGHERGEHDTFLANSTAYLESAYLESRARFCLQ
jgi:hypothetical protein